MLDLSIVPFLGSLYEKIFCYFLPIGRRLYKIMGSISSTASEKNMKRNFIGPYQEGEKRVEMVCQGCDSAILAFGWSGGESVDFSLALDRIGSYCHLPRGHRHNGRS